MRNTLIKSLPSSTNRAGSRSKYCVLSSIRIHFKKTLSGLVMNEDNNAEWKGDDCGRPYDGGRGAMAERDVVVLILGGVGGGGGGTITNYFATPLDATRIKDSRRRSRVDPALLRSAPLNEWTGMDGRRSWIISLLSFDEYFPSPRSGYCLLGESAGCCSFATGVVHVVCFIRDSYKRQIWGLVKLFKNLRDKTSLLHKIWSQSS